MEAVARNNRLATDALLGAGAAALLVACLLSPAAAADGPVVCPFRLATGLPCPGCGSVRAWVATTHGDLPAALAFNPFATAGLFVIVGLIAWRVATLVPHTSASLPALRLGRLERNPVVILIALAWLVWAIARAAQT